MSERAQVTVTREDAQLISKAMTAIWAVNRKELGTKDTMRILGTFDADKCGVLADTFGALVQSIDHEG